MARNKDTTHRVIAIVALIVGIILILRNLGGLIEILLVALGVILILYAYHTLTGRPLPKFLR